MRKMEREKKKERQINKKHRKRYSFELFYVCVYSCLNNSHDNCFCQQKNKFFCT